MEYLNEGSTIHSSMFILLFSHLNQFAHEILIMSPLNMQFTSTRSLNLKYPYLFSCKFPNVVKAPSHLVKTKP